MDGISGKTKDIACFKLAEFFSEGSKSISMQNHLDDDIMREATNISRLQTAVSENKTKIQIFSWSTVQSNYFI